MMKSSQIVQLKPWFVRQPVHFWMAAHGREEALESASRSY
jgi:hypothetical protein